MHTSNSILLTFAGAVAFGVLFNLVASKLKISSIVVLLIGGILVGPHFLGLVNPESLGNGLKTIISLSVGLILFEGGLTLDLSGYRSVSREIKGVLTKGVLITWFLTSLAIKIIFSFDWDFSLLSGSLIIVTGPTVIGPLLKRIHVKSRLHNILHWEGVLIDPIGVFIALLCYEWMINPGDQPIIEFLKRLAVGISFGSISGLLIASLIRRRWIPQDRVNITFLASAITIFAISDLASHESGLLSVTIAGMVIGYLEKGNIEQVKIYKAELIQLLIGLLFVLLAANLNLSSFPSYGYKGLAIVIFVMFFVRPLNIFASTYGLNLPVSEKLFLSWVAPRGVVAASMASLFALNLKSQGNHNADFLEAFTYAVIIGTVVFQGFTSKWVAKILGVLEPKPRGWLIVGAHKLGRLVATFIQDNNAPVVLLDVNNRAVARARQKGLKVIKGNALSIEVEDHPELYEIGNVLAITENEELNTLICQKWSKEQAHANVYKWGSQNATEDRSIDGHFVNGQLVWKNLKLNKIVAADREDEIGIVSCKTKFEEIPNENQVVMCSFANGILPFPPKDGTGDCSILVQSEIQIGLDVNITPDWVITSDVTSLAKITERLLQIVKKDYPKLDTKTLYDHLIDYESRYSGLICPDTALPHTYTNGVDDSIVLFAKLINPIKSTYNDEFISLVFLILSPENEPKKHLGTLSEVSKFLMDDEVRARLIKAGSKDELLDILLPNQG